MGLDSPDPPVLRGEDAGRGKGRSHGKLGRIEIFGEVNRCFAACLAGLVSGEDLLFACFDFTEIFSANG